MDFSEFSYTYTCFIILALLFIITAKKDLAIFVKINTFGVIFTIIIIVFIICIGITALSKGNFKYETYANLQQYDEE